MTRPTPAARRRASAREPEPRERARARGRVAVGSALQASATVFLVLRRMRVPLIILVLIFALSVLGLTLIPGQDAAGQPTRMGFFEAFYFMSYTATTIGFGELPHPFTDAQRLWVMVSIYLTVIGWAYAIGAVLTLLQDHAFRHALKVQHVQRKVARLREPFLLLAGYGQTGELLARSFDLIGRRLVVVDRSDARIDALDLASYHADVPALVGDARNAAQLQIAGLGHPFCEGVLALTDDDGANLAVTMAAALMRPDLPVVARTVSPEIARRMSAFGAPTVVNPFDRFGEHLVLALRAPASYQLLCWLSSGPGADLPPRGDPPRAGHWTVCGFGRFGRELTSDLRAEGLDVTVIEPVGGGDVPAAVAEGEVPVVVGDGADPEVLARAGLERAVGFVAGTADDTTNLSLVAAARAINPGAFIVARQNSPTNAALFRAMNVDSLLVPTEMVAQEVYAQLSTPLLWRFLQQMPAMGDAWAAEVVERLAEQCGPDLQALWKVRLTSDEAPALRDWLVAGDGRLGDLLRNPENRDEPLHIVALMVLRGRHSVLGPDSDFELALGDELLLAGRPSARRALETTMAIDATREYVLSGRRRPASWLLRRLSGSDPVASR